MRPTIDRSATARLTSSSATSPPKRTVTSLASRSALMGRPAPAPTGADAGFARARARCVPAPACRSRRPLTIWCTTPRGSRASAMAPSPNRTVGSSSHAPRQVLAGQLREHREGQAGEQRAGDRAHPPRDDDGEPHDAEEHGELLRGGPAAVGREQGAADPGDERAQAEDRELRSDDADAERGGGRLARAHGVELQPGRRALDVAHEQRDDDEADDEQVVEGQVVAEALRAGHVDALVEVVDRRQLEVGVLDQHGERERGEREVEVADPQARERGDEADRHDDQRGQRDRDDDRDAVVRGQVGGERRGDAREA